MIDNWGESLFPRSQHIEAQANVPGVLGAPLPWCQMLNGYSVEGVSHTCHLRMLFSELLGDQQHWPWHFSNVGSRASCQLCPRSILSGFYCVASSGSSCVFLLVSLGPRCPSLLPFGGIWPQLYRPRNLPLVFLLEVSE